MKERQESRFYEAVLSCVTDGVFTVDSRWRITSFNTAAERITGVPASQAIGRKCSEVFHADICEEGCAVRRTLESGKEVIGMRARILASSGRAVPISLSTAILRDAEGAPLGVVESFRDLSALEQLRREIGRRYTFEDIVGRSEALQKVFAILPDVAESDSTVLIEGPSGSGKELLARAIHNLSSRSKKPYVVVNCSTLPHNLFESELFGYVQGAFTDAKRDKPGRLALAEGGTVFFDEIGELPQAAQVKLLRVLQEREFEPLGAVAPRQVDVRVVAATNKKLLDQVSKEKFRDDLYFRLAVVRLAIPPLRERREDIPYLVEHFIERFNAKRGKQIEGVSPEVMQILMRCDYPGNARELENLIEYAFVLCRDGRIELRHLPEDFQISARTSAGQSQPERAFVPLKQAEADAIHSVLRRQDGHLVRAAQELGISRTTLWRKMKKHGIDPAKYR